MRSGLHCLQQVAFVQAVHQVGDDFAVGLASELVALGLQCAAQIVVAFDDAVVHRGHATGRIGVCA
jgi:hypothetical protein